VVMPSRDLGGEALGLLCRRRERPKTVVGAAAVHLQGGKSQREDSGKAYTRLTYLARAVMESVVAT